MKEFAPRSLEDLRHEWPPDLKHISASSLKMWMRCPEQWRRRYVLHQRVPPAAALIQGRADHQAIAGNFEQKLETQEDLAVSDVAALFVEAFEGEIDKEGGYAEVDWGESNTSMKEKRREAGRIKDRGVELVSIYHKEVSPWVMPESVEYRFDLPAGDLPVAVIGYIDLTAYDVNAFHAPGESGVVDGTLKMIERKTSATKRTQPEWAVQALVYQQARPLDVDFHLSIKQARQYVAWADPKWRVSYTDTTRRRGMLLLQQLVSEIGLTYQQYGPDLAWPGHGLNHPWACGYCGYAPLCWWKR